MTDPFDRFDRLLGAMASGQSPSSEPTASGEASSDDYDEIQIQQDTSEDEGC